MMSKKKNQTSEKAQPSYIDELLTNGKAVLTAKTREGLAEMVNDIPAEVRYSAGAVGYNPDAGVYLLRVDIVNN